MATATQGEGVSHLVLCGELRTYLEYNEHPAHTEIHAILQKVEEINSAITTVLTEYRQRWNNMG